MPARDTSLSYQVADVVPSSLEMGQVLVRVDRLVFTLHGFLFILRGA